MTRRILVVAMMLVWLPLGVIVDPAQAQDAAKGAALLAEARQALGGAARLGAVKRLQVSAVSKRAGGGVNLEGELDIAIELPNKYRRKETLTMGVGGAEIERVEGFNAGETWEKTSGGTGDFMGRFGGRGRGGRFGGPNAGNDSGAGQPQAAAADPERIRAAQLRNRQAEADRLLLAVLLTTGDDAVTWIGTAQSPDGSADVLEMTPPSGPATRVLLDSASHMPLMITWQAAGFRGGRRAGGANEAPAGAAPPAAAPVRTPVTMQMHLSDYKVVGGIKLPHLITRGVDDQVNEELQIKGYKLNPSFKADTFTAPK